MFLIFDTETSGKVDHKMPPDHPCQPHIAQLAAILFDKAGEITNSINFLITPNNWEMSAETTAVNGLTKEHLEGYGVPLIVAMSAFSHLCKKAKVVSAFNIAFDHKVALVEYYRLKKPHSFDELDLNCVMLDMMPVCKIPSLRNFGDKYKWPKLAEAFRHVYQRDFEGAHDALADVKATAQLFFHLKGIELKLV